jgi:hypothetical protein
MATFEEALTTIRALGSGPGLTQTIARLERRLQSTSRDDACRVVADAGITDLTMQAALLIKAASGQIDVVVHAVGILTALPHILGGGEVVEILSLGAGNTGRRHDLETNLQVAEFKFIEWRGGPESIRQNSLFIDLFNLATAETVKRRVLYVVGKATPLRFLNNRRALSSVLSKNVAVAERFKELHGDTFRTVREYYASVSDAVEIVDLREVVPALCTVETDEVVSS